MFQSRPCKPRSPDEHHFPATSDLKAHCSPQYSCSAASSAIARKYMTIASSIHLLKPGGLRTLRQPQLGEYYEAEPLRAFGRDLFQSHCSTRWDQGCPLRRAVSE